MFWWIIVVLVVVLLLVEHRKRVRTVGPSQARRLMRRCVMRVILIYSIALGLLLMFENKLIYHPSSDREYWQPPPGLKYEDVHFHSSSGDTVHAWWCPQSEATWTILFSHGNAGNLSGHAWIIPALSKHVKANVLIYDYPGYGKSSGKPSEPGCCSAADAAYGWLVSTKKIPDQQIILMGQSLGGALACDLAVKYPHRAIVLLSPFTSIRDIGQELFPIFPVRWLVRHQYDNVSKLKDYHKPLFIGHGDRDEVIPFHHGERLFAVAGSPDKAFHRIPNGTHNSLDSGFFAAMKSFLDKLK